MSRPPRPSGRLLAGLCACFWLCFLVLASSVLADAYVPPPLGSEATEPTLPTAACPEGPAEPYSGEDHAAGELRLLRAELVELCGALATRSDEVSHRLWWLVAEADGAAAQRALSNALADELTDQLATPIDVTIAGSEVPLEVDDPEGTESVAESVDAAGAAIKEAVWFLIGLLTMAAGFVLYKQVRP